MLSLIHISEPTTREDLVCRLLLEKWHDEITPEELDEIKWNLKEIQNSISNIENKLKK